MKNTIAVVLLLAAGAPGQSAPKRAVDHDALVNLNSMPGISVSAPMFPLPPDLHAQFRDFQHESEKLEIENQKMLLQIEKNKARQVELSDQMKLVALRFANATHIDLSINDLDPEGVKFVKKGKP